MLSEQVQTVHGSDVIDNLGQRKPENQANRKIYYPSDKQITAIKKDVQKQKKSLQYDI